jgi:predicted metal-dependent peptidase
MTVADSSFNLNMHTHRLLQNEPFFAALSRRIDKRATTSVPTAGVHITKDGRFEMLYNPDFMERIIEECGEVKENRENPYRWVRGILMHEFYHLIYGHVTTRMPEEGMSKLWNIATDLAINTHIADEIPTNGCIPGRGPFTELETGLSADAYYKILQDDEQASEDDSEGSNDSSGDGEDGEGQGQGEGGEDEEQDDSGGSGSGSGGGGMGDADPLDDHSGWGEATGEDAATSQQIAEERLKQMVKDAVQEAGAKGWGSVSASMRKQIVDSIATKVDWKKVLRSFVKASQKANRRSTVKRINKRFPYIHAGKRAERVARVAISIDQSGSVSDTMLKAFFAELEQLSKYAEFVVVPFDTRVDEDLVYTWKKGEKKKWERVMSGGTCFNAPSQYVNDNKFDGHIVLTDMCAEKPIPSKCRRMWMTDNYGATQPYFKTHEKVLEITT